MQQEWREMLETLDQCDSYIQQQLVAHFGIDLAADEMGSIDNSLTEPDLRHLTVWDSLDELPFVATAQADTEARHVNPYVKLKIPFLDGRPQMLFSDSLQADAELAGVEMPIKRYLRQSARNRNCIFLGVSGCGKTRTCFDLCR